MALAIKSNILTSMLYLGCIAFEVQGSLVQCVQLYSSYSMCGSWCMTCADRHPLDRCIWTGDDLGGLTGSRSNQHICSTSQLTHMTDCQVHLAVDLFNSASPLWRLSRLWTTVFHPFRPLGSVGCANTFCRIELGGLEYMHLRVLHHWSLSCLKAFQIELCSLLP